MVKLIKRNVGGYGIAIPVADNAPLTLFFSSSDANYYNPYKTHKN
jgi:hypothetical protein